MSWLLYLPASLAALIMFLRLVSLVLPRGPADMVRFAAFMVTAFIMLLFSASYGVVASILCRCAGYGGLSQWTTGRSFKWLMWWTTGVTFSVHDNGKSVGGRRGGEEALLERPAVFVGNHQSELDVLMLGCIFPQYCSVTAKSSLKWMPFLGWFMSLSKTVFIDRANRATARAAFDSAVDTMRSSRQSVFIFPEGTRSYASEPTLLPFKKGAFHLAVQAQVPIVPIVCANYSNVLDAKKRRFNPGVVDVSVLPPIPTKGLTSADVDRLVEKTRNAMMEELVRLSHVSGTGNGVPLPRASGADNARGELRKRV
ncbi:1-acylglycerol-3-phosphate O-acyltransferase [Dothidotthia symphoricarpi CBS 119687]|uniref:1-acyl-sn-glycerol-3-phosphate acyltransferase n=1 Tax=Dothidotthia symphoricarpi CBS 119687 TaxID=1392245 RepID=A0A6A5ZZR9_9PLEO|nr:1-acylglycerol-3-phosphate O-acyltransferase [Dothidotthia symphoricarpi CBS 119687]KAF2124217.1 1-acylglycerol-3-phosphate O-acyltransferase [Dothidotthia symphoricarpi CBS 119687]